MTPKADAGPLYGMMLPILISVSVAPVSYFFCASADEVTAARISPVSPRYPAMDLTRDLAGRLKKIVVKKSLARRFMRLLLRCGPGLTASCWEVSPSRFFLN